MKFTSPPARFYLKALLIALLLGGLGFFIYLGAFGGSHVSHVVAFAAGISLGALLGAILAGIGESRPEPAAAPGEVKSIFVGNLAFKAGTDDIRALFVPYGTVHSVRIMTDRMTRKPRGYAFVEMDGREAQRAIAALDGREFMGRKLRINEGKERREGTTQGA